MSSLFFHVYPPATKYQLFDIFASKIKKMILLDDLLSEQAK